MRDTIWLRVDKAKVVQTYKSQPSVGRHELAIKIQVEVDPACWGAPTLEQKIHITDWREGLEFPDVKLTEMTITPAEAERIRHDRELKAAEELRKLGWHVEPPK